MKNNIEQLIQIFEHSTWDGNLISKSSRDELVKSGLVAKAKDGWNIITKKGIEYLVNLGIAKS